MKLKELDIVSLLDGRTVTVLEVYDGGKAFLVETAAKPYEDSEIFDVESNKIAQLLYKS